MDLPPEGNPGEPHTFATTHWSVVIAAGDSTQEAAHTALNQLCQTYWYPLYVFVRRKGIAPQDAQDLTQAFFEDFLTRNQVARADPERGRFRSFLLRSLENFLHNQWRRRTALKRGGTQAPISFDASQAEDRLAAEPMDLRAPDQVYVRKWAQTLLQEANLSLEREWSGTGRSSLFTELLSHLWSDPNSLPYADLCARFDLTPVNLRVTIHRFRQRYRELLRQTVASTVADPADVDDELRFLIQAVQD